MMKIEENPRSDDEISLARREMTKLLCQGEEAERREKVVKKIRET